MTIFASVATFSRGGRPIFLPPRREVAISATQARKAATTHWQRQEDKSTTLLRVYVVNSEGRSVSIAEHEPNRRGWRSRRVTPKEATKLPHLAAALAETGYDAAAVEEAPPAVLVINGWTYRRDPEPEDL